MTKAISTKSFAFRAWFYFRTGYATYLVLPIGYISTLVTIYYLAIKATPALTLLFPQFLPLAILAAMLSLPIGVIIGWLHLHRTAAFSSEVDIQVENNPYYFKVIGYQKEVYIPLYLELLHTMRRILEREGAFSPEEQDRFSELEDKLRTLQNGGFVGK